MSPLVTPPWPGGAERAAAEWAEELEAAGADVLQVGLARPGHQPVADRRRRELVVPLPYWPFDQSGRQDRSHVAKIGWHLLDLVHPVALARLVGLMRQARPDLVVVHNIKGWSFAPFLAARMLRLPVLAVLHDYDVVCVRTTLYRDGVCDGICAGCKPRAAVARLLWRPSAVATVSAAMWTEIVRRRPRLGRGVPRATVRSALDVPRAVRDPAASRRVGYLGRLDDPKGVQDVLAATQGLGLEVLVAGPLDTGYARRLVEDHAGRDDVTFLGPVDRDAFLRQVHVVVVPSRWREPYGRVAREALLSGARVVAADQGGLREAAVGLAGATFVPPGDVAALRGAVQEAAAAPGPGPADGRPAGSATMFARVVADCLADPGNPRPRRRRT